MNTNEEFNSDEEADLLIEARGVPLGLPARLPSRRVYKYAKGMAENVHTARMESKVASKRVLAVDFTDHPESETATPDVGSIPKVQSPEQLY